MKVLFLDIDGVLNTTADLAEHDHPNFGWLGYVRPDLIANLNYVIEMTSAVVVLSSSWRHVVHMNEMDLDEFEARMRELGLHAEFVGVTPYLTGEPRAAEILSWLRSHEDLGVSSFVIVDDDVDAMVSPQCFVRTEEESGLTKIKAEELISKLCQSVQ